MKVRQVQVRRDRRLKMPAVERLEARAMLDAALPDIAMDSASTADSRSIQVTYEIRNAPVGGPFEVGFYRSDGPRLDTGSVKLGQIEVSGSDLSVGAHTLSASLAWGMPIDPAHPYVLAVANPDHAVLESDQANETNDAASFRVYVIGAVTHGLEPGGTFPAWVPIMASSLKADGYDRTIAFDWAASSDLPVPGTTLAAGLRLAASVVQEVASLPPGSVVDLHLIGHSRGGVVISQAMIDLQAWEQSGAFPGLKGLEAGWSRLTFLDPHPAHNIHAIGAPNARYFSASSGPLGRLTTLLTLRFQADALDPELIVPSGVDQAEVYFQHTDHSQSGSIDEQVINFWGEVPIPRVTASADLTGIANGHAEVYQWYQQNVVPTLGSNVPFLVPRPSGPTTPPSSTSDLDLLFPGIVNSRRVASGLLARIASADSAIAGNRIASAEAQLGQVIASIKAQTGKHVTPEGAALLIAATQEFLDELRSLPAFSAVGRRGTGTSG